MDNSEFIIKIAPLVFSLLAAGFGAFNSYMTLKLKLLIANERTKTATNYVLKTDCNSCKATLIAIESHK